MGPPKPGNKIIEEVAGEAEIVAELTARPRYIDNNCGFINTVFYTLRGIHLHIYLSHTLTVCSIQTHQVYISHKTAPVKRDLF